MFALLVVGGLLIVLNYVGVWPSAPSNWYLLGGILAIPVTAALRVVMFRYIWKKRENSAVEV